MNKFGFFVSIIKFCTPIEYIYSVSVCVCIQEMTNNFPLLKLRHKNLHVKKEDSEKKKNNSLNQKEKAVE